MSLYRLVDAELALLDGQCRPEIQKDVDAAKARLAMAAQLGELSPAQAGLIADMVTVARQVGRLSFARIEIRYCRLCERSCEYVRFRSGRRRGKEDSSRPILLAAVDFNRGFVVMQNHASLGCCWTCWLTIAPRAREALADVQAALPEALMGQAPAWVRWDLARCTACGWEGHEGELRKLRTMMNDGWYPGGCPKCPAENGFLRARVIERPDGFVVVPSGLRLSESNTADTTKENA